MVLLWSSWILRTIGLHKLAYQFEEQTALNRLYTVGMLLINKILIACAVAFQNSSRVFKVCYYLKSWAAIHLLQQHQWAIKYFLCANLSVIQPPHYWYATVYDCLRLNFLDRALLLPQELLHLEVSTCSILQQKPML